MIWVLITGPLFPGSTQLFSCPVLQYEDITVCKRIQLGWSLGIRMLTLAITVIVPGFVLWGKKYIVHVVMTFSGWFFVCHTNYPQDLTRICYGIHNWFLPFISRTCCVHVCTENRIMSTLATTAYNNGKRDRHTSGIFLCGLKVCLKRETAVRILMLCMQLFSWSKLYGIAKDQHLNST